MEKPKLKKISEAGGLPVGAKAPGFQAVDLSGQPFSLLEALKSGPVVLVFYRGQWCPVCNRHLRALQAGFRQLLAAGANVIAVSPERPDRQVKTKSKTGAEFRLLYDESYRISTAYGLTFRPDVTQLLLYNFVLRAGLAHAHSDHSQQLPIPATYIIGQDGVILWRHFDPDYRKRSSLDEIMANLPKGSLS